MKTRDETLPCRNCGAEVGSPHDGEVCDIARCQHTGQQLICCGAFDDEQDHECTPDIWTGLWPGTAECREFGWYARFDPPKPGHRYGVWAVTTADDPRAHEDLNRLAIGCVWDRDQQRWVKRPDTFGYLCIDCEGDLRPPGLIPRYPVAEGYSCPNCGTYQLRPGTVGADS